MTLTLRPYQTAGVEFLRARDRAFLADEAGLGKSSQLLTAAAAHPGPILVVMPAMVLAGGVWQDEIAKWVPDQADRIHLTSYTRLGSQNPGGLQPDKGYYQQPARWARLLNPEVDQRWGAVILDEAHYLKGRGSLRSNYAQAVAARADRTYLASGTPIPNFAPELFPLLQALNPGQARPGGDYGSYWRWVARWFHVTPNPYTRYAIGSMRGCTDACAAHPPHDPCEHYREFAAAELGGVFLQRRRDEVLTDLPPLTEVTVEVPMGAKQRAAYRSLKKTMVADLGDGDRAVAWSQSAAHVMLDQLTTGLDLLTDRRPVKPRADNAKLARLAEDLEGRSRPTLVMAHYQSTVEACVQVAAGLGLKAEAVYGPVPAAARTRRVRQFQAGELDVLVGSLETLAEGLTLVAADLVVFVERSWKPSRNEQALRRIHRIGQTRPVTALDYVTPGSIDAGKRELLAVKTDHQLRVLTAAELARIA